MEGLLFKNKNQEDPNETHLKFAFYWKINKIQNDYKTISSDVNMDIFA